MGNPLDIFQDIDPPFFKHPNLNLRYCSIEPQKLVQFSVECGQGFISIPGLGRFTSLPLWLTWQEPDTANKAIKLFYKSCISKLDSYLQLTSYQCNFLK